MQQFSVLIADDDAVIRMGLRSMIEELGHTVVGEAAGGYEACRLARELRPAIAILDVRMHEGSGLEAAAIMSKERLCPVLLLTAYSEAPLIEEAMRAGVLAYLVKPVTREELGPALQVAAARYRELIAIEAERERLLEERLTEQTVRKAAAVLVRRYGITGKEAQRRMEGRASATGKTLREVAEAVLLAADVSLPNGEP